MIIRGCLTPLCANFSSKPRRIHSGQKDKEKEEYGVLYVVICCEQPPSLPHPPPPHCAPFHLPVAVRIRRTRESLPPHTPTPVVHLEAAAADIEDGLWLRGHEYGSLYWTAMMIMYEFSAQWICNIFNGHHLFCVRCIFVRCALTFRAKVGISQSAWFFLAASICTYFQYFFAAFFIKYVPAFNWGNCFWPLGLRLTL